MGLDARFNHSGFVGEKGCR